MTSSSKISKEPPRTYSKVAVIVLAHKTSARANVEEEIATLFRTKGIKAVSTYTMFPLANHMDEVIKNSEMNKEQIQQRIREKINFREIDAILILTLLNTATEERYVQKGVSLSVAAPTVQYADPVYNYEFTDYYSYSYATIYKPGYYEMNTTYFVESNLYAMDTEELIYTAQFNIKNPDKLGEDSEEVANVLVNDILSKKALAK
jgi:hypothetical protein